MKRIAIAAVLVLAACSSPPTSSPPLEAHPPEEIAWPYGARFAVSIHYDDTRRSSIDIAAPALEARGFRGSFAISTDHVGPATGTWEEWRGVARRGHELLSHTASHRFLWDLAPEDVWEEMVESNAAILANTGCRVRHLVYPGCAVDSTVKAIAAQVYDSARCGWGFNDRIEDPWRLKGIGWGNHSTYRHSDPQAGLERCLQHIDRAAQTGTWFILYFHGLGDGELAPEIHERILDYLEARGAWVATHSEAWDWIHGS